ncbi:hypothetical protein QUF84_21075 [Fictibacillus enclensis]|uniref:LGFP repeat-containing protein n=1 Tax=Fictibacillus enclensis TaxID=1017270 RepID=UPI0025A23EBA|nr:hypothetical protein [Fictibacillus enclensis]MDM5339696.1 hypothetical protein [Fictibacillus enclensis]
MNRHYWYNYPVNTRDPFGPAQPGQHLAEEYAYHEEQLLACAPPSGTPISCKYYFLKKKGFTGTPIIPELPTAADGGVGRYRIYRNSGGEWIIVWHTETGAHEIHGTIYEKWKNTIGDNFGFPITDELTTPDGIGRFNHFRRVHEPGKPEGSIYWTPQTGAHMVLGAIRDKWAQLGWERSPLGYPVDDQRDPSGAVSFATHLTLKQRFQHGSIIWNPETGAYVEGATPPTPPIPPPPPVQPSQPTIIVIKQNSNIVVTGSNFKSNASIRIRIVVGVIGNEYSYYANSNEIGSFTHPIDVSGVPQGTDIFVSATDGRPAQNSTGFLWSNTVPMRL